MEDGCDLDFDDLTVEGGRDREFDDLRLSS